MKQLPASEQRWAFLAAGLATAVCLAFLVVNLGTPAAVGVSGIGIVSAGLLAVAAKRGSRLSTGVGATVLALVPSPAWVVGLPYLMVFGWFTLRASRAKLQEAPEPEFDEDGEIVKRPARVRRPPRAPRGRRRGPDGDDTVAAGADGSVARKPTPPPSKRYTPPQRRK